MIYSSAPISLANVKPKHKYFLSYTQDKVCHTNERTKQKQSSIKAGDTTKGSDNFTVRKDFVCVEVLPPSQPNGVMSSVVSLPNHTFTGQA